MSMSDVNALPPSSGSSGQGGALGKLCITLNPTEDEDLIIRKAAELQGWSVTDYVRAAVLDRAERDLYEQAAASDWENGYPATSAEPITSLLDAFTAR
jgi:Protein of unknown function (DUF1778)